MHDKIRRGMKNSNKKAPYLVLALVLLVGLTLYLPKLWSKKQVAVREIVATDGVKILSKEEVLDFLPLGFPIEQNIEITTPPQFSSNVVGHMVTYEYISNKSVSGMIEEIQDFLNVNKNWESAVIRNQTKTKTISATNTETKDSFLVTITPNGTQTTHRVFLVYVDKILAKAN